MIFFVPFVVAFWVLFGAGENAKIIAKKQDKQLSNAFLKFNDVVSKIQSVNIFNYTPALLPVGNQSINQSNQSLLPVQFNLYHVTITNFAFQVYSVWALTMVTAFPTTAIEGIDRRIAQIYLSLYYLVMSILSLNLFIALLSQVFSQVFQDTKKYVSLEQAKSILSAETFLSAREKICNTEYLQRHCKPLVRVLHARNDSEISKGFLG